MEHLIDKDALVAEINQRIEDYKSHKIDDSYHDGLIFALEDLRDDFINTIEVKEMDLEKELNDFIGQQKAWIKDDRVVEYNNGDSFNHIYDLEEIAKHFFKLGMQVSNKAQK